MSARSRKETILLIEDNETLALGLRLNLVAEGYAVTSAKDGRTGLTYALEENPDLVVLDLMLPEMDGFEILSELRQAGHEMKVIVLSARGEEQDKLTALGLGADDYMTKPFSLNELLARINASLRRSRKQRTSNKRTEFAGFEIDLAAHRVFRNNADVQLSPKEYDLLIYLIDRPGRVQSRDLLLSAVWGYDYNGTARTVDNFVRNLRVKLESDPSNPRHIVTVRGVGYRFDS